MKKLLITLALAALAVAAPAASRDKAGWRCEGDCGPEVKCRRCNPPPKAKKAAKKSAKKTAKKSAKKTAKKTAKKSAKKTISADR